MLKQKILENKLSLHFAQYRPLPSNLSVKRNISEHLLIKMSVTHLKDYPFLRIR